MKPIMAYLNPFTVNVCFCSHVMQIDVNENTAYSNNKGEKQNKK